MDGAPEIIPAIHYAALSVQVAAPERMGEAVSAATFGLPEDSVRVRLEVALIPPQARPNPYPCMCMSWKPAGEQRARAPGGGAHPTAGTRPCHHVDVMEV